MKIHDWYCQGFNASCDSHRRTVADEIVRQIPSVMTCSASSGQDHRDSGRPLWAAGRQANAFACAICTGVNTAGRPDRFASVNEARPGARLQRRRNFRTVSVQLPRWAAIAAVGRPWAACSTILTRSASRCEVLPARASLVNCRRWAAVRSI